MFDEKVTKNAIVCDLDFVSLSENFYVFPEGKFNFFYTKNWSLFDEENLERIKELTIAANSLSLAEKMLRLNIGHDSLERGICIGTDLVVWGCKRFTIVRTSSIDGDVLLEKINSFRE